MRGEGATGACAEIEGGRSKLGGGMVAWSRGAQVLPGPGWLVRSQWVAWGAPLGLGWGRH